MTGHNSDDSESNEYRTVSMLLLCVAAFTFVAMDQTSRGQDYTIIFGVALALFVTMAWPFSPRQLKASVLGGLTFAAALGYFVHVKSGALYLSSMATGLLELFVDGAIVGVSLVVIQETYGSHRFAAVLFAALACVHALSKVYL